MKNLLKHQEMMTIQHAFLLDFSYHNCYNLIGIDLSRQTQIGVLLNKLIL